MAKTVPYSTNTRLYRIWVSMRARCNIQSSGSYKWYGAKGIRVCEEWSSFGVFEKWAKTAGYNDALTLDRINSDKDYSPDNCRWVTWTVQANNRTGNHLITYCGEQKTISQWARLVGIPAKTLYRRINDLDWSIERALETPIAINKRRRTA